MRLVLLALALQFTFVSVEQEIAIGREADAQVRREMRVLNDADATTYLRTIGRRLTAIAGGPTYPYTFGVIDDGTLNAFALPGGPVWVHRGLIRAAATEAQLAGVLAHEVAHVSRRHAAAQLTKVAVANLGLSMLGAVLGNGTAAAATQTAAALIADGAFLKFSRDDERDADRVGLDLLRRGGWDPRGMIELFELLRREAARDPGTVEGFFSSHPSPVDRITALRGAIGASPRGRRDSAEFQRVRRRLR